MRILAIIGIQHVALAHRSQIEESNPPKIRLRQLSRVLRELLLAR